MKGYMEDRMDALAESPKVTRRDDLMVLAGKIEDLDDEMQTAIEEGNFEKARRLADEQERLLEHLMLLQKRY